MTTTHWSWMHKMLDILTDISPIQLSSTFAEHYWPHIVPISLPLAQVFLTRPCSKIYTNILHQFWLIRNFSDDSDSKCPPYRFDHPWTIFRRCSPSLPFSQKVVGDMIITIMIIFMIIITMINDQVKIKHIIGHWSFFQRVLSSCEVACNLLLLSYILK